MTIYLRDALEAIAAGGDAQQIARQALDGTYVPRTRRRIHARALELQMMVAEAFGISLIDLLSRRQEHANKRHLAMWICRETLHFSYPHLGKLFDRDHTVVKYAVDKVSSDPVKYLQGLTSDQLRNLIDALLANMRAIEPSADFNKTNGSAAQGINSGAARPQSHEPTTWGS